MVNPKDWRIYLALAIILLVVSTVFSYAPYDYSTANYSNKNIGIEVSPLEFSPAGNFYGSQSIKIILSNYGNSTLFSYITYGKSEVDRVALLPNSSDIMYIQPNTKYNEIYFNGTEGNEHFNFSARIHFISPVIPITSDILMLMIFPSYFMFLKYYPGRWRYGWISILIAYFLLSPFYGQRYDMYFAMTSPLRLLYGINPFIGNSHMPGGLKWAYPPLFLTFGVIYYYILHIFNINFYPTYTILVPSGFEYSAWRGFYNSSLPILYFLEKIPIVLSTFLIYFLFLRRFKLKYSRGELEKFWILNPFIILIGSVWGQFDMVSLLFMILSILFFERKRTDLAIISATTGAFIKIFPAILIPYILLKSDRKMRDLLYVILISLISIMFYVKAGNPLQDIEVLIYSRGVATVNGYFFANGITWQIIPMYLGVKHFPTFFPYLLIPIYFILLYLVKRLNLSIIEFSLIFLLSFFIFYNFVNPQYFVMIVSLFLLLEKRRYVILFSLVPSIYVLLNYSLPYFVNYYYSYNYFSSILGLGESLRLYLTDNIVAIGGFALIATAAYILTFRDILLEIISRNKSPDRVTPSGENI